MKTDLRSMLMAFSFFFVLSTFFADFLLYGAYASGSSFPSYTLISFATALGTARASVGWNISLGWPWGGLAAFLNAISTIIQYFVAPFIWLINVISYVIGGIAWFFGLVTFPCSYIPYPYGSLVTVLFYAFIGISVLTAVRGPTGIGMHGGRT